MFSERRDSSERGHGIQWTNNVAQDVKIFIWKRPGCLSKASTSLQIFAGLPNLGHEKM
jgi:hypothetical protein